MDPKKVFNEYNPQLVHVLPLKDSYFIAELTQQNLFSGNLKEEVMIPTLTQADAATIFLHKSVELSLSIGKREPFDKLLLVMEKFDNEILNMLAKEIKQKFTTRDLNMDKPRLSLKEQGRVLSKNRSFIIDYLDPDDVTDELIQAHIIGQNAKQQLQQMGISRSSKNQIIFDQLFTAGPGSLQKFCNILRRHGRQQFIADEIEKTMSSTANNESVEPVTPITSLDVSHLRARYKRHLSVSCMDWLQQYVQLALVKQERVTRSDKDIEEITKLTLQGQIDEVLQRKVPLQDLKDIFHCHDTPCPRIILIVGAPGIGKTTLVNKICQKWANKEFLAEDFDAVILVPLKLAQERPLEEVVMEHAGEEVYQKLKKAAGKRCLIILEGLNELAANHWENDKFFTRLIFDSTLFEMATVIITSRQHASERLVVDRRIEVVGFSTDKITEFVNKSIPDDAKEFLQKLEEYPYLQGLCYIPLNLVMMIDSFYYSQKNLPPTVTELYRLFIVKTLQRQVQKNNKNYIAYYPPVAVTGSSNAAEETLRQILTGIPEEAVGTILLLSKLAYCGLYKWHCTREQKPWKAKKWIDPKVVFTLEDLTQCRLNVKNQFDGFGLLKATCTYRMPANVCTYSFAHLTIQEFLCAVYILTLPSQEQEVILTDSYQNYPCIFIFVCGLLRLISSEHKIFQSMYSKLASNCRKAVTAVKCVFESQLSARLESATPFALNMNLNTLLPYDCVSISYVLSHYPVSQLSMWGCLIGQKGAEMLVRHYPEKSLHGNLLQKFNLYDNNLTLDGLVHIMKIINSNSSTLMELDIGSNSIGDDGVRFLCGELRHNRVISELRLEKCGISEEGAEYIRDLLKVTSSLQTLDISCNSIGDNGVSLIAKELQCNVTLTRLKIENCGVSVKGAVPISELLSVNQTLQILEIGHNNICDDGISVIMKKLQLNATLIKLRTQKCGFSSKGITHIDEMLTVNCTLQVLVLEGNDVDDDGMSLISKSLYKNTSLTELWVQRCSISVQGAVCLSKALMVNATLQVLNLCGNNIGDDGIIAISEALQYTNITALYIRGCGITFSGAKLLAEALKINRTILKLRIPDNLITVEGANLILQSAVDNGVCEEVWISDKYWRDDNVKKLMNFIESREKAKKPAQQCKWK